MALPKSTDAARARIAAAPPATRRRLLVLLNPTAGRRRQRRLEAALAALRAEGCAVEVEVTKAAGEPRRLAGEADAGEFDAVIAAGGDGTINETVNGLARNPNPPAFGAIPLGTANVFARNIGLPLDPVGLARRLAYAPAAPFLPGRVNGRLFVAMAGIGFDARVVAGLDLALKRRIGQGAYVWQSILELARNREARFEVRCGVTRLTAAGVVASRGRHYGGGYVMARGADPLGAGFELSCIAGGGRLDIVRQALALGLGRFDRLDGLTQRHFAAAEVLGPESEPIQADGDLVGYLPARIDMAERPIQVLGLGAGV